MADIWYQMVFKLIDYYMDESKPFRKRIKAFYLYTIMSERVLRCVNIMSKSTQPKTPSFESGGLFFEEGNENAILKNSKNIKIISNDKTQAIINKTL